MQVTATAKKQSQERQSRRKRGGARRYRTNFYMIGNDFLHRDTFAMDLEDDLDREIEKIMDR